MIISKMVMDWFTEADGKSFDVVRLLYVCGVLSYIGMAIWALAKGDPWNPQDYGYGFAAVLASGGAAIGLRANFERPPA
ncbi:MAG: hypothetical protein KGI82_00295 [Betaproteobacteria bacterium]|nr:hypothetical protein [Betaproteobacteria bacterium]